MVPTFTLSAQAEIIGADDFSEADGTFLDGKASDTGGTWSATGGQTIVGGAVDTASVGAHQGSFLTFTRALASGETLYLGFETVESALDFNSVSYAGISLYTAGSEQVFIGDPGGGGEPLFWSVDGPFAGLNASEIAAESAMGVFTYEYDTGAFALYLDGTMAVSGFGTAGLGIDQLRIQGNSEDGGGIAVSSFVATTDPLPVPEPAALGVLGLAGLCLGRRRRPA